MGRRDSVIIDGEFLNYNLPSKIHRCIAFAEESDILFCRKSMEDLAQ
jgi:hypothetical protein